MWLITCPNSCCGYQGPMDEFEPSLADECACPKCETFFEVDLTDDEDDDEDGGHNATE